MRTNEEHDQKYQKYKRITTYKNVTVSTFNEE